VVRSEGGGHLHLWVPKPREAVDQMAAEHGLARGRDLLQMRVRLPLSSAVRARARSLELRPFTDADADEWLSVNNRAFAHHPEQGHWTAATLADRRKEPWFDAKGFLLHERDGRLAGFCWTKVHADHDPPLGEIYVIAVDPDFQGLGLGRDLVVAGLDHLAARGLTDGMLYVDASNEAAVSLYEALGFAVDHLDRAYVADIAPA
jgi:mycothiol synthase